MDTKKVAKREEKRVKLDLLHAFGSLGHMDFKDGVTFVDDTKIKLGYPVGKYFAVRTVDKADTTYIKLNDNLDRITSLCTSKNRKSIAIAQRIRGDNFPQLAIYQVRGGPNREREKVFRYTETKSDAFVHMAFGEDIRFLAILTGYADCQLIFLDTSRMRAMATAVLGVGATRVSISPKDNHIVAVTGDKMLKILRVHETSFKSMGDVININHAQKFIDHAWIEEGRLIVANDQDTVYVIQQNQVIQVIDNCFNMNDSDMTTNITSLAVFERGFIIGSDNGTLSVWTRDEDDEDAVSVHFSFLRTKKPPSIKNPELAKRKAIVSMDVNPTQDLLAICFKNNDIATVSLDQLAPAFDGATDPFKIKKALEKEVHLNFLYNGFHNGPVTCIDICVQRPLIATCSTFDSTIRIWNYATFKSQLLIAFNKLEDTRNEVSPVLSLALHPSGYYLAVGFGDRLEIYHICSEELRSFKKIIVKNATCLKFSNGGHMLAVAYPRPNQSHYYVNLYNSYTMELLTPYPLKGPVSTITDLLWTKRDESVVSCGLDGSIFEWKINPHEDFPRNEFPEHLSKFTALAYTYNGMILACGNDGGNGIVKEVKPKENYEKVNQRKLDGCLIFSIKVHKIPWGKLMQIVSFKGFYNTPAIVGGTSNGVIKVFPELFSVEPYDSICAHMDEITKISASPDGRYVFTIGKDHCILIFQVTEILEGGGLVSRAGGGNNGDDLREINACALAVDEGLANFVLLSRNEIEKFRTEIKQLRIEVEDLQDKILISAEEDRKKMENDQAEAEDMMRTKVKKWEDSYSELQKQKNQLEKEYANLLKVMESNHMKAVEELENLYEKKLSYENDKYVRKEEELKKSKDTNMDVLEDLNRHHEETIDKLERQYRDEFGKTQKVFETNKNTADLIKMEYEEKLNEIEEEHETEIKDLKAKQKKEIDEKKTEIAKLRHENERFRRDQKESKEEKVGLKKSEEEKDGEIKSLKTELDVAAQQIERLNIDIKNEEERINRKNQKIYDYKSKISDLQKSKHVLSYRTAEMRKDLEPKEAQIEKLKDELFKLEKEFEGMLKTGQVQTDKLVEKENKIEELSKALKANIALSNKKENLTQKMIMDIYHSVKENDPKELGNELRRLFKEYCGDLELRQENHDPRSVEEMVRQIQHLEKSINQMGRKTDQMVKRREQDIYRKTMENSDLICDLNDLRKANKKLESDIYNLTKQNENLKKEKRNIGEEISKVKNIISRLSKDGPEIIQNINTYQAPTEDSATKMPSIYRQKQEQAPSQKGRLIKGSMFDMKAQSINDRNKLVELMAEIEVANRRIIQQDEQLMRMREKVINLDLDREESRAGGYRQQITEESPDSGNMHSSNLVGSGKFQALKIGLQGRASGDEDYEEEIKEDH